MCEQIIIVGASALAREIFSWLSCLPKKYELVGFIDDNKKALDGYQYPINIISTIDKFTPSPKIKLVMAVMDPTNKKKIVDKLLDRGAEFTTYIHPSVIIGQNVQIGAGCVIAPNCILTADILLKSFVFLNTCTTLGHDVSVGNYTSINGKVEISGHVQIGSEVTVGSMSVVLPKKKIASGATVGAGSVVVGNINSPLTVFGNPAKRI